jgi:hypothetical protein
MDETITLKISAQEKDAISNALNYFCHGTSPGECSAITGMRKEDLLVLLDRILDIRTSSTQEKG